MLVFLIISGCTKKENNVPQNSLKSDDERIIEFINAQYHCKEVKILNGVFKPNINGFAAVYEVNAGTEFGIKFMLAHIQSDSIVVDYNSKLVDGAVNQSIFERVRITDNSSDAVYYNSSGYFMGSGGGEVFAYVVDFNETTVSFGHVYVTGENQPKLYIPATVKDKETRNFLLNKVRVDFPNVKLVNQDFKFVD
jgi:hypothetical protein